MRQPTLTQAQHRRLAKLAREAGRTPQSMLRFVLRDGFEQCEDDVQAARLAEAELARSGTVPHQQVMNEARATIARQCKSATPPSRFNDFSRQLLL
jgi:predicted transcriptional regulator